MCAYVRVFVCVVCVFVCLPIQAESYVSFWCVVFSVLQISVYTGISLGLEAVWRITAHVQVNVCMSHIGKGVLTVCMGFSVNQLNQVLDCT